MLDRCHLPEEPVITAVKTSEYIQHLSAKSLPFICSVAPGALPFHLKHFLELFDGGSLHLFNNLVLIPFCNHFVVDVNL